MKYIPHHQISSPPKAAGFLLVSLLVTTFLVVAVGISASQLVVHNYKLATTETYRLKAQFSADAGADYGVQQIRQNSAWTGTAGEVELHNSGANRATYQVAVTTSGDGLTKTMTVTGRTYAPVTSTTPIKTSKVEVSLRGVGGSGINGDYSLVAGVGGAILTNNSDITGGKVFVNGTVSLDNSDIGTTTTSVNVQAAHQSCPTTGGATYPQVCTSGQPISLTNYSDIYGDVRATNQTNGADMSRSGLIPNSVVAPSALPSHDRAAIVNAVNASGSTMTGAAASCSGGSRTWPANVKITGNVSVTNYCDVTVQGNVWISGNLTSSTGDFIVASGITTPPHIMIDGSSGVSASNNSDFGNASIGFRVVTYWSSGDPCATNQPSCTNVTGTALFNSKGQTTINIDDSDAPKTQFYARWSKIVLANNADVGAAVGQTIQLNNSDIAFGGLNTNDPGESGTLGWNINSYKRVY